MTFTEWLTHEMQMRGWNQANLADRSGITRGAVSHIFSGTRQPGVEMLQGMARAMGLPVETLFRAAGFIPEDGSVEAPLPAEEAPVSLTEWVRMFLDVDDATREVMLENARFFARREAQRKKAEQG